MIGNNSPAEPYRVWELSYPEGKVKRITNNTVTYSRMSLAADSQALLAVQVRPSTNLWIVPANEPHQPRKMTFGSGGYRSHLRWISGRKIVFESATAGTPDISIMDEDGGNQRQLLGDIAGRATAVAPAVTPDERYIVFAFDLTGTRHIWRMDIDGGNLVQLTNGGGEDQPHCSADSKWVVFTDIGSERSTLWKVPIDGGEAVQLTTSLTRIPSLSPDGKWIACYYTSEALAMRWKMALVSPEGGEPVKLFPQTVSAGYPPKWTPDGSALTYTEPGRSGIWLQPVHGGKARRIVDFTDDLLFGFEWSPDGKQLACVRGIWERDLVLMRNFR